MLDPMRYMGGKTMIARHIVEAILTDTNRRERWFEPFVGGGNVMERAAPHFAASVGSDIHEDLILMWQHVAAGGALPELVSREEYQALRRAEPSWLRGLAGFGASFGGRWFGGYGRQKIDARHPVATVYEGSVQIVRRQGRVLAKAGTRFVHGSYAEFTPPAGTVVYCDPPYAGTKFYSSTAPLDYPAFYRTLQDWAENCDVYVSEYAVPEEFPVKPVWETERRRTVNRDDNATVVTERLFKVLPR